MVIATPANEAAKLLQEVAPKAVQDLKRIRHANIGTISLVYHDDDIPEEPKINGLMVPRREKRKIDAVTFTSHKLDIRSTEGFTLLRVFFGGGSPETVLLEEVKLLAVIRQELSEILGINAKPVHYTIFRWPDSFPQADVGHLDLVKKIKNNLPKNIMLAGSSYQGIGVPDCIQQGKIAASDLLEAFPE